jgi:hypothetical protein
MKKSDLAMIILIAAMSVMVAFFGTKAVLGDNTAKVQKVKTIEEINTTVADPDPAIFNSNAINPAVEVQITPRGQ